MQDHQLLSEKRLTSHYIYKGKIINVRMDTVQLPNEKTAKREIVEHHGGVCVVALTDENAVLTVRQHRCPYDRILVEIPAGKLERGEDPLACGKRELEEETGYTAGEFIFIGQYYPSPGYCGEIIYMYLARRLIPGAVHPDSDEFLQTEQVPLELMVKRIIAGQIKDGKTQAAVLKTYVMMKSKGLLAEEIN